MGNNQEQKKAKDAITHGEQAALNPCGSDDFNEFSMHFTVLLLREIKRAKDPVLESVLSMIRLAECGAEVDETRCNRLTEEKVDEINLDKTVVICSTRVECADVNEQRLEKSYDYIKSRVLNK